MYKASTAPHTASTDPFCKYDDPMISLFVSVLFLAGIPGAFLGSWTNTWFGRRPTMIIGGGFFFVGSVLMAAAVHVAMLVVGRISLGVGVGICVQCGPLFLSELAPAHLRGLFNTQFQLFITFGIVAAQARARAGGGAGGGGARRLPAARAARRGASAPPPPGRGPRAGPA